MEKFAIDKFRFIIGGFVISPIYKNHHSLLESGDAFKGETREKDIKMPSEEIMLRFVGKDIKASTKKI